MTHHIRAARWVEKDLVAAVIAEAFQPTPLATWLVPDEEQRGPVLTDVAIIWVEHAMFFGDVHITADLAAATVCFHRLRPLPPPVRYTTRLAIAAGSYAERFTALDDVIASRQPTEPHHHLACLAVRPTHQRAGRGRALMTHLRSRLDGIELPSWTVTLPAGQHLFTQFGYDTDQATVRPTTDVTMHPMTRTLSDHLPIVVDVDPQALTQRTPVTADAPGRPMDEAKP